MNKIILTGRITKDPEISTTASGIEVCNFTIAVDRRRKKGDEKITDFVDCTAWQKSAAFLTTYFHKGDGITVSGRLESRRWMDNDGKNRVSWGVTVEELEFPLGGKRTTDAAPASTFPNGSDEGELPF